MPCLLILSCERDNRAAFNRATEEFAGWYTCVYCDVGEDIDINNDSLSHGGDLLAEIEGTTAIRAMLHHGAAVSTPLNPNDEVSIVLQVPIQQLHQWDVDAPYYLENIIPMQVTFRFFIDEDGGIHILDGYEIDDFFKVKNVYSKNEHFKDIGDFEVLSNANSTLSVRGVVPYYDFKTATLKQYTIILRYVKNNYDV